LLLLHSSLWLLCSSSAANAALNYINYPTRVIFRSCKLVPTIIISMLLNSRQFQLSELILGIVMSFGMVLFALADYQVSAVSSSYGMLLVGFSVVADSVLPNLQVQVGR
jgi:adenosine 3'-phospho 5'-phosphosulfate transporter B3